MISLDSLNSVIVDNLVESTEIILAPIDINNSLGEVEENLRLMIIQKTVNLLMVKMQESINLASTPEAGIAAGMEVIQGLQNRILEDGDVENSEIQKLMMIACMSLIHGVPELLTMEESPAV